MEIIYTHISSSEIRVDLPNGHLTSIQARTLLQQAVAQCKSQHITCIQLAPLPVGIDPLLPLTLFERPQTMVAIIEHLPDGSVLEFEELFHAIEGTQLVKIFYKKEGTVVAEGLCDWKMSMDNAHHFFNLYVKPKFRGSGFGVPVFRAAQQVMSQLTDQKVMKLLAEPFEFEWSGAVRKVHDKDRLAKLIQWYSMQGCTLTAMREFSADMECDLTTNALVEPSSWEIILKRNLFTKLFG